MKRLITLLLLSFTFASPSQAQPSANQGVTDWLSRIANTEEHLVHREQIGPYLVNGDGQRLIDNPYLKLDIRENGTRIPADSTVKVDAILYHDSGQSRSSYTPTFDGRYFVIDPLKLEGAENWSWNDNGWLALDITIDGAAGEATGEVGFPVYPPKPEAGTLFRIVNVGLPFVLLGLFVLVYRVTGTRLRQVAPSS